MIISSMIHGAIFRVLRHMNLSKVILLAVLVIGGIYLWQQKQGYRPW